MRELDSCDKIIAMKSNRCHQAFSKPHTMPTAGCCYLLMAWSQTIGSFITTAVTVSH